MEGISEFLENSPWGFYLIGFVVVPALAMVDWVTDYFISPKWARGDALFTMIFSMMKWEFGWTGVFVTIALLPFFIAFGWPVLSLYLFVSIMSHFLFRIIDMCE